jgi:dethiobiotin synthetase/adenosylmethionine--8-amino-7-oxononanoate aminotransferase
MRDLCSSESRLLQGCHTLSSTRNGEDSALPEKNVDGGRHGVCQKPTPAQFTCQTMWSWFDPVSPHLAAAKEGSTVSDLMVLNSVQSSLQSLSDGTLRIWEREDKSSDLMRKWALVETAGGVASPGPSGTLQCDLYRPLRLPGVLVGDGKLGGISSTVGAYESLQIRGYDTIAIVLVDSGLSNEQALCQYLKHRIPVFVLPQLPQDPNESLASWFSMAEGMFADLRDTLERAHSDRIKRLVEMPRKASQILWWPFTQHSLVKEGSIAVIDSRCGENFSIFKVCQIESEPRFVCLYDKMQ